MLERKGRTSVCSNDLKKKRENCAFAGTNPGAALAEVMQLFVAAFLSSVDWKIK